MSRIVAVIMSFGLGLATVFGLLTWADERAAPRLLLDQPAVLGSIAVEVRGAVARPGTYTLAAGSRYGDAIEAAGGFAPDADLASVNVARQIGQPAVVDIPAIQPTAAATATRVPKAPATRAPPTRSALPGLLPPVGDHGTAIDINRAGADELEQLPGIGPTLAARIVADREANGPYATVDDLARVKGISPRMIDEMRPMITAP